VPAQAGANAEKQMVRPCLLSLREPEGFLRASNGLSLPKDLLKPKGREYRELLALGSLWVAFSDIILVKWAI